MGGSYILAFFVFFRRITCINGEVGRPVRGAPALDGPHAIRRFTLREPTVETGDGDRLTLRRRGLGLLRLLPHQVQSEALFAQQLSAEGFLLAKQAEEQMHRADVLVVHAFGFLGRVGQRSLGFVAERQVYRR